MIVGVSRKAGHQRCTTFNAELNNITGQKTVTSWKLNQARVGSWEVGEIQQAH